MKTITLFYRNAATNSDKVYRVSIVPNSGGFCVNFQFGKRGGTLADGTKTRQPVALAAAETIFAKLVAEKRGKGYTEDTTGTPFDGDADKLASVLPYPNKKLVTLAEARQWASADYLIQRKYDGDLATRKLGNAVLLGQLMRAKSGAFLNDEDRALIAAHGSFFVAFTVMELDGQNMLAVDTRTRNAALLTLSGEFPADVVMAGAVSVPESIPADVEGYCAHAWGDSWGNMLAVKQASIYVCRVSSTGGTQSVGIVDAGTGEPRGNVKLGGGKIDRVRVGSVIRVEGMGLTDKGLIRQPVCCREWLVE